MNKTTYNSIHETVYDIILDNGLHVYLLPKKGYHKTFVSLSTPLGSNVTTLQANDETIPVPLGTAHFLEHKLFDQGDGDVSEQFALHDAQVNAYTMNQRTTYLFSCTSDIYHNLDTLFDFVFQPTFTEKGIQEEIGIIEQEISMYEDDPNSAIYMGLLQNMYHHHPIQYDILGTPDSLQEITVTTLETVHNHFYHPSHMILFITGQFDLSEMKTWLSNQNNKPNTQAVPLVVPLQEEPETIVTPYAEKAMDVIIPNALKGIKLTPPNPDESIMKQELTYSILGDLLFGKSTTNYQIMMEQGLINDTFGMDVTLDNDYGFVLFGSHTKQPKQFLQTVTDIITKTNVDAIDEDHFIRTKKQIIGHFIQALNSLEYIAGQFTKYHYFGGSLFDVLNIAEAITIDDVATALSSLQDQNKQSSYIIWPKQKDD